MHLPSQLSPLFFAYYSYSFCGGPVANLLPLHGGSIGSKSFILSYYEQYRWWASFFQHGIVWLPCDIRTTEIENWSHEFHEKHYHTIARWPDDRRWGRRNETSINFFPKTKSKMWDEQCILSLSPFPPLSSPLICCQAEESSKKRNKNERDERWEIYRSS